MSEFWIFTETGWRHVLDIKNYSLILFLIALAVPYSFKEWKKLLLLTGIFNLGCFVALLLSAYGVIIIKPVLVEFLIPITVLILALFNLFTSGKSSKGMAVNLIGFVMLFFGMVHGLEFSTYFKSGYTGNASDKIVSLLQFELGIIAAQTFFLFIVLVVGYIIYTFFRFSKRDFSLVLSSFVIGVALPMILENQIWKN